MQNTKILSSSKS